jgi:diguanylate cyclase (GGDEF)-like protein/PAS domain S-box-containing protein
MKIATAARRRRVAQRPIALPTFAAPRYAELCKLYPGPAALIDRRGIAIDSNDAARAMLDALDRLPGGLAALAASLGRFARFEAVAPATAAGAPIEVAIVPLAEGVLLLGRTRGIVDNLTPALAESRARYKDLVEISSDFVWETDRDGRFCFVSPRGALGYAARELIGRFVVEVLPLVDAPADAPSPFVSHSRLDEAAAWLRRHDGEPAYVAFSVVPLLDDSGAWIGCRGVCRDLSEANAHEVALREAENRDRLMAFLTRALGEGDADGGFTKAVRAYVRALGGAGGRLWRREGNAFVPHASCGEDPPADLRVDTLASSDDGDAALATTGNGRRLVYATTFRGQVNGAIAVWRDRGEEPFPPSDSVLFWNVAAQFGLALANLDSQLELARQARIDALTGLLNRRSFLAEIERRLRAICRAGRCASLVYLDLDNFKPINDRRGHAEGDALLRALGEQLNRTTRASDLAARLGGDEFALWLEEADEHGARAKAAALLALARELEPRSAAAELKLGFSIGIAVFDSAVEETAESLIERADQAMYAAKRAAKGGYVVAPPARPHA